MDREQHYRRIQRRGLKQIAELEQIIRDIEWWNRNRTDAAPFDCEWARVQLDFAKRAQAAWDRGDTIEAGKITAESIKAFEADDDPYGSEVVG